MTARSELFVRLLDEDVDVWRPVLAEPLGGDVYRIAEQDYDRDAERWEFEPGDEVLAGPVAAGDEEITAAISVAPRRR